jgi:hypothetical protein
MFKKACLILVASILFTIGVLSSNVQTLKETTVEE